VSAFVYGPSLLGSVAGLVADRVRRRPLLLVVNLSAAALLVPLALTHPLYVAVAVCLTALAWRQASPPTPSTPPTRPSPARPAP
jgi:predicted MFS family arabinose efflux permease